MYEVSVEEYERQRKLFLNQLPLLPLVSLDMNLFNTLRSMGKTSGVCFNTCAYYSQVYYWFKGVSECNPDGTITIWHKSINQQIGLTEKQDQDCLNLLLDAGYIGFPQVDVNGKEVYQFQKYRRRGSTGVTTARIPQWVKPPMRQPDNVTPYHFWKAGIKEKFSIPECVVLAELMFNDITREEMAERTGISRPSIGKFYQKYIDLGYMTPGYLVNYEKLGVDVSQEAEQLNVSVILNNNVPMRNRYDDECKAVISQLNKCAEKRFNVTVATRNLLTKIFESGYTVDDCYKVIEYKCNEWLWLKTDGFDGHACLRPSTLFGDKFEEYLNTPTKYNAREIEKRKMDYARQMGINHYQETGVTPFRKTSGSSNRQNTQDNLVTVSLI